MPLCCGILFSVAWHVGNHHQTGHRKCSALNTKLEAENIDSSQCQWHHQAAQVTFVKVMLSITESSPWSISSYPCYFQNDLAIGSSWCWQNIAASSLGWNTPVKSQGTCFAFSWHSLCHEYTLRVLLIWWYTATTKGNREYYLQWAHNGRVWGPEISCICQPTWSAHGGIDGSWDHQFLCKMPRNWSPLW